MTTQALFVVFIAILCLNYVTGLELMPTRVLGNPDRTEPRVESIKYSKTFYKDIESKTQVINTWPSSTILNAITITSLTLNQTVETDKILYATSANYTLETSAPHTYTTELYPSSSFQYYTLDYQHETLIYSDKNNITRTEVVDNKLPL